MKIKIISILISCVLAGGTGIAINHANGGSSLQESSKNSTTVENSKDDSNSANDQKELNTNKGENASKDSIDKNGSSESKLLSNSVSSDSANQDSSKQNGQAKKGENKSNNKEQQTNNNASNVEDKNDSNKNSNNNSQESKPAKEEATKVNNGQNSSDFMAQVESRIFQIVNEERQKAGVKPLSYSDTMQNYARIKSKDMADRGYFDHADPQGKLMVDQMKNDGVKYSAWGENIAYIGGQTDPNALAEEFMTNWMNSPGHRKNILSNDFSGIGVGVYKSGNTVYATQEFYR